VYTPPAPSAAKRKQPEEQESAKSTPKIEVSNDTPETHVEPSPTVIVTDVIDTPVDHDAPTDAHDEIL
jgi:hypothetical protein